MTEDSLAGLILLVPGGSGQLGSDLAAQAGEEGAEVFAPTRAELDVSHPGAVVEAVGTVATLARAQRRRPVVINAAAYTAVDDAETDERRAFAVNADGPRMLAAACTAAGVPLVHVSTDYVFAGDGERPYEPDDPVGPSTAYGRTKLAGENAVLHSGADSWVVRTAWVYGAVGSNFVKAIARLERERDTLSVVDDQRGAPTWSSDLAGGLLELVERIAGGDGPTGRTLHCTGGGEATWCEFARAIFTELGADPERVHPCGTQDYPRPARRPAYSVLSNRAWSDAGLAPLRDWREALSEFVALHREQL